MAEGDRRSRLAAAAEADGDEADEMVLRRPWLYEFAGGMARKLVPWMPRWMVYNPLNGWGKQRDLPEFPKQSFRELYKKR